MHIVWVTSVFPELPVFLQPVDTVGQKRGNLEGDVVKRYAFTC